MNRRAATEVGWRFLPIVLASLLLVLSGMRTAAQVPGEGPVPLASGAYVISGTVVNALGGHPLDGARVIIADTKHRQRMLSMLTSDDGHFAFHVGAGKYSLQAEKRDFITAYYMQHEEFSTAIVTGAGLDTENLALRLAPTAVIVGKVFDENGDPVRLAQVTIYKQSHDFGISRVHMVAQAITDDLGSYEAAHLDNGTYFVSAKAKPWYAMHPPKTGNGSDSNSNVGPPLDVAYPTTYYADTSEADEATPIPLRGGDHPEVDFHLNPVPALHLLIHVPEGGFAWPELEKRPFDGTETIENEGGRMVSPGLFEMVGVPAGRYSLSLRMPGEARDSGDASREIDLTEDGQQLESTAIQPSTVTAILQMRSGESLPRPLNLVLRNPKGAYAAWAQPDAQGMATFQNVPAGEYVVLAGTRDKAYSVTVTLSGSQRRQPSFSVTAGTSINAAFTLVGGEVTVEGIAKLSGKPVSGAMIVLVPKDADADRELFRRDQSDQDGTFGLPSVLPGHYTVVAIDDGWDVDWGKPAVIDHYLAGGRALVISDDARGVVRLAEPVEVQLK